MNTTRTIRYRTNEASSAPPLSPVLVFAIAVLILAVNFVVPKLGVLLGIVFAAWAVWMTRAEYVPALLLVHFSRSNFAGSEVGSMDSGLGTGVLNIGIPLTVPYIIGFTMAARITYELFTRDTFRRSGVFWLLLLWYAAIPLAFVMAVLGKFEANPSWTSTIRTVLMAGAFFYGMLLLPTWPQDGRLVFRWLVPMISCLFLLNQLGYFSHRFMFLLLPLGVPLSLFTIRRRGIQWKLLGAVCIVLVGAWGMEVRPLGARAETDSDAGAVIEGDAEAVIDPNAAPVLALGQSTFTLNGLLLVSSALAGLYFAPVGPLRKVVAWGLAIGSFPVVVAFSITIAILSPRFVASGSIHPDEEFDPEDQTLEEKFMAKLFDDRSKIWNSALDDALHAPYFIRPAGRPIIIDTRWGRGEWSFGAHNVLLESLKSLRWVAGVSVVAIVAVATFFSARALLITAAPLAVLGIGTFATATIGCVTGHYPLTDDGAFVFLGFAGLCAAQVIRGAGSMVSGSGGGVGNRARLAIMTTPYRTGSYQIVSKPSRGDPG